jgi:hypothetical protein
MVRFVRNLKQGTMVCSASVQDAGGAATGITGRGGSGRDRYASARGAAAAAAAMARSKKPAHFAIELVCLDFLMLWPLFIPSRSKRSGRELLVLVLLSRVGRANLDVVQKRGEGDGPRDLCFGITDYIRRKARDHFLHSQETQLSATYAIRSRRCSYGMDYCALGSLRSLQQCFCARTRMEQGKGV